jgi:hypothetical protein
MDKLRIRLNTEIGYFDNNNDLIMNLKEYNIDSIIKIITENFSERPGFHYNVKDGNLILKIKNHTIITIDFYSVMIQRELRLKEILT